MSSVSTEQVLEGKLLTGACLPAPDQHLFNTPAFFNLHNQGKRSWFFQWELKPDKPPVATLHVTEMEPGLGKSPGRGTFGGFSADPEVDIFDLQSFYDAAEAELRQAGVTSLVLTQTPSVHDPSLFAEVFNLLQRRGFVMENHELNYHLVIDDTPFTQKISYGNHYKFKKSVRDGLRATFLTPDLHQAAYDIIADNQTRKGYPVTMTFEALELMHSTFPNQTQYWGVYEGEDLVGASVCFQITAKALYLFYWGFKSGMERYSPNVLLTNTLYETCREKGVELLDIGISTLHGEPNEGLICFKRRLGLRESLKLTWRKEFV